MKSAGAILFASAWLLCAAASPAAGDTEDGGTKLCNDVETQAGSGWFSAIYGAIKVGPTVVATSPRSNCIAAESQLLLGQVGNAAFQCTPPEPPVQTPYGPLQPLPTLHPDPQCVESARTAYLQQRTASLVAAANGCKAERKKKGPKKFARKYHAKHRPPGPSGVCVSKHVELHFRFE